MVKLNRTKVLHNFIQGVRLMLNNDHTLTLSNSYSKNELKKQYITKINKLLTICDDISLLDLISKLLEKSV